MVEHLCSSPPGMVSWWRYQSGQDVPRLPLGRHVTSNLLGLPFELFTDSLMGGTNLGSLLIVFGLAGSQWKTRVWCGLCRGSTCFWGIWVGLQLCFFISVQTCGWIRLQAPPNFFCV